MNELEIIGHLVSFCAFIRKFSKDSTTSIIKKVISAWKMVLNYTLRVYLRNRKVDVKKKLNLRLDGKWLKKTRTRWPSSITTNLVVRSDYAHETLEFYFITENQSLISLKFAAVTNRKLDIILIGINWYMKVDIVH